MAGTGPEHVQHVDESQKYYLSEILEEAFSEKNKCT